MEFTPNLVQVRPVVIDREKRKVLEDNIMLFYTGLTRFASEVVKEQIEKTRQKSNDASLKTMKEMVYQAEMILTQTKDVAMLKELGLLLLESWRLKKRLSSQISNTRIDEAYERALSSGAYGGKLCGAGSGGFLLLVVEKKSSPRLEKPFIIF